MSGRRIYATTRSLPSISTPTVPQKKTKRRPKPVRIYGRCHYCGSKTDAGRVACYAHSDLPAIDPFFSPDTPQKSPTGAPSSLGTPAELANHEGV